MFFPPLLDHCKDNLNNNAPVIDENTQKYDLTSIVALAQKLQKPEEIFSKLIVL